MYCLLYFDIHIRNKQLNYPLPKFIDIAILDESLNLQGSKQFLLPLLKELSKEALLNSWRTVLESIADLLAQEEIPSLIFPTKDHFKLFLILKKKFKLNVSAAWCGNMEQIVACNDILHTDFQRNPINITKMISTAKAAGAELLAAKTNNAAVSDISKEEKAKLGMMTCNSYSHIVDTRTKVFHSKGSLCLERIPFNAWQGTGKNPAKRGFTPCHLCYGKSEYSRIPVISGPSTRSEKQTQHRLVDGQFGNSNKIFAYCHLLQHRGYLTKTLLMPTKHDRELVTICDR